MGAARGGGVADSPDPDDEPSAGRLATTIEIVARYGLIVLTIGLIAYLALRDHRFLSAAELQLISLECGQIGVVALPLTLPFIVGGIDLSFPGLATLAVGLGVLASAPLLGIPGTNAVDLLVVTAAAGVLIGLANGLASGFLAIPSFLATLVIGGLCAAVASKLPNHRRSTGISAHLQGILGGATPLGIPSIVLWLTAYLCVLWVLLERTPAGRAMYAVGWNPVAARVRGISVRATIVTSFAIAGGLIGFAGLLRINSGIGPSADLTDGLSCVFLGAAVLRPGQFHVVGTAIGVVLMGLLLSAMTFFDLDVRYQSLAKGLILVAALAFAGLARGQRRASK